LKRDGSEARRIDFHDCFPNTYKAFDLGELPAESVEEITISCPTGKYSTVSSRAAMLDWLTETLERDPLSRDEPWRRTVTIRETLTDGSAGKTYEYFEAFPTKYVLPKLDVNGTGVLHEEFTFKVNRMELA
ncbi:MAG: hypothetical protein V3S98_11095, partial [Dehalococcoidia bacterium]